MVDWPRSRRTGHRSQWMTERPPSSRITVVALSEPADGAGAEPWRAKSTDVLVLAGRHPAAGGTARKVITLTCGSQVESRVAAIAADDHASFHLARHLLTLTHERPELDRPSCVLGPRPHYSCWRPRNALPRVTSSAYSRSAPTGKPLARRVTATLGARSRSRSAM